MQGASGGFPAQGEGQAQGKARPAGRGRKAQEAQGQGGQAMQAMQAAQGGQGRQAMQGQPGGGAARAVVDVIADYAEDGSVMPREIEWGDGRKWPIERIAAVGAQPGGQFLRFTCQVRKQWMYLLLPARVAG